MKQKHNGQKFAQKNMSEMLFKMSGQKPAKMCCTVQPVLYPFLEDNKINKGT